MSARTDHDTREQVFAAYYAMGSKRSLKKLAEMTGRSYSWIKEMSRQCNWQGRLAEIESRIEDKFNDAVAEETAKIRAEQLRSIRKAQEAYHKQMQAEGFAADGSSKDKIAAYKDLILMDRLLTGETTSNSGVSHEEALSQLS